MEEEFGKPCSYATYRSFDSLRLPLKRFPISDTAQCYLAAPPELDRVSQSRGERPISAVANRYQVQEPQMDVPQLAEEADIKQDGSASKQRARNRKKADDDEHAKRRRVISSACIGMLGIATKNRSSDKNQPVESENPSAMGIGLVLRVPPFILRSVCLTSAQITDERACTRRKQTAASRLAILS